MNLTVLLIFVFIITICYVPYKGRNFIGNSKMITIGFSLWFTLWSSVLLLFIKRVGIPEPKGWEMVVFGLITLLWFLSPLLVRTFGKRPSDDVFRNARARQMLHFESGHLLVKYAEICFQQVQFAYLVLVVFRGLTDWQLMAAFTAAEVLVHLGNLLFYKKTVAMSFVYWSIPMGIAFSLAIRYGHYYSTASIHLLFYLIESGRWWMVRHSGKRVPERDVKRPSRV